MRIGPWRVDSHDVWVSTRQDGDEKEASAREFMRGIGVRPRSRHICV